MVNTLKISNNLKTPASVDKVNKLESWIDIKIVQYTNLYTIGHHELESNPESHNS